MPNKFFEIVLSSIYPFVPIIELYSEGLSSIYPFVLVLKLYSEGLLDNGE